jgi:hypothetical protein
MKTLLSIAAAALILLPGNVAAQAKRENATATIGGKTVSISYTGPSVRGRKVFTPAGPIAKDPNYPVWRAGADTSTTLHTETDLTIGGLAVPKGDYALYVNLKDVENWELIINKQTGQWGLTYDQAQDLGRVKMKMAKPAAPVEVLKYTITGSGKTGKITLEWENYSGSVDIAAK